MGGLVLRSPPHRLPDAPATRADDHSVPIRLRCGLLELAEGLVGGEEGFLLPHAGQGLPADCAADAAPAAGAYDLVAVRLQCRVSRVLPLLDQAVVGGQARMVLPAHGPRVPDSGPPLKRWNALTT